MYAMHSAVRGFRYYARPCLHRDTLRAVSISGSNLNRTFHSPQALALCKHKRSESACNEPALQMSRVGLMAAACNCVTSCFGPDPTRLLQEQSLPCCQAPVAAILTTCRSTGAAYNQETTCNGRPQLQDTSTCCTACFWTQARLLQLSLVVQMHACCENIRVSRCFRGWCAGSPARCPDAPAPSSQHGPLLG